MPKIIADLQAKLQEQGESQWRKRVQKQNSASEELRNLKENSKYIDKISEKSLLSMKKVELFAASRHWESKIEKTEVVTFPIAGKIGEKSKHCIATINTSADSQSNKKTPEAKRFKLKKGDDSVEKNVICEVQSTLDQADIHHTVKESKNDLQIRKKTVSVLNPDDIALKIFFDSIKLTTNKEQIECSSEDFDAVKRQSLLVNKKNIKVQKRRGVSKNPVKVLSSRTDIFNEYTEVITGVAEKEKKRLIIEKLAKNSNKAFEALAGLASNEDFKLISLKKNSTPTDLVPWKDLMLLQIKGRRHVQTRLVEPVANSINEGDNFILISSLAVYTYNGAHSNIIEQSKVSDIVNHLRKTGDLGCRAKRFFTLSAMDKSSKRAREFWRLLGSDKIPEPIQAGHQDEDETFESGIIHTNMIYTLDKDELVPHEKYWGSIPKVGMLNNTTVIVFDFGSEMYVWSGKNAGMDEKKLAFKLCREVWEEGYNYSGCDICPLNAASMLGARRPKKISLEAKQRPEWALFAKLTQHRETILFKEKFLDWPSSKTSMMKSNEKLNVSNLSFHIQPCNVNEMMKESDKEPDLLVENTHLGRGDQYFDEDTRRRFKYETLSLSGWRILEYTYEKLADESLGYFHDGESYIFRWDFRQTVKGRELNGNPSKYAPVGRDRCVFFFWQGNDSSNNEKGTAALLTIQLDKQNAPQVRVIQGREPAAFLQLFKGNMVISRGRKDTDKFRPRLFIVRGEINNEIHLLEVTLRMKSLRSRSSFLLLDTDNEQIIIWHGSKSNDLKREVLKTAIDNLLKTKPSELFLDKFTKIKLVELNEGCENENILHLLGGEKESYHSLLDSNKSFQYTPRLFSLSSLTGKFEAIEILCPHRSEHCNPYPFVQLDLYSASQPALFLFDNDSELWLWQGYWPENEIAKDQTGSGAVRWQAERKAAMQTAVEYWKKKFDDKPLVAYLVSAGMEPVAFKNLFPTWEDKLDIMELNKKDGKKNGEMLLIQEELNLLSRTTYSTTELLHRPLPDGVDPTNIEKYLSPDDFVNLFSMTREEFDKLPKWKKTAVKKEKGLF